MTSPFPKYDKRHSKIWAYNVNAKFWGRALYKYVIINIHTHIYEELLSKRLTANLGLTLETHLLEWLFIYRSARFTSRHG